MSTLTPELTQQEQQAQKANRLHEASILKRANPQLQNAIHLAITEPHADQQGYNSKFGGRASQYVAPGSVASMFSPAAYLTELYRQARGLHADNSDYHLDKRRPDLKLLTLSQQNMDDEVSTLSLSNKVLLEGIKTLNGLEGHTSVMKALSTFRYSGSMPYHDAYENICKAIQLQAPIFDQFNPSPETDISRLKYQTSLLGVNASVSPELFNILTEEITEENANEKFEKNFGDREPSEFLTLDALKHYYNLTNEELEQFLNHVLIENNSTYTNNQLINISINTSGTIQLSRITRTPGSNYNNLNYMNLYPIQNRHFYVDISYKKKAGQVSIRLNSPRSEYLTGIYKTTIENTNYSSPIFKLTDKDIQKEFILLSYRYKENSDSDISDASYAKFQIQDYSPAIFLLKLNKTIRLSHATKLLPTVLKQIVSNINQKLDINTKVLEEVFRVKYYMQRYGIDSEAALVLCNAPISQRSYNNQPSQFDRLFNIPLLNGQYFSTEDEEIDLNPSSTGDWRKSVIKRAFNIDDISLYRLLKITNHNNQEGKIKNNLENLSNLYLGKLLAEIHQLTIDELDLLLVAVGEGETNLSAISDATLATLIRKLNTITGWLQTQKWSVFQLFVMTSTSYNKTLTPEIKNLLDTAYQGLQGFDKDKADLLHVMAPYIAATLQLSSENVAHSVLLWADKLQPGDGAMTAEKFWDWLNTQYTPGSWEAIETQEHIVQYCQALAQLEMVYHSTGINENAFRLFVTKPEMFSTSTGSAPTHDALSLIMLTRFADWVNALGEKASSVLAAFEGKTLTAEQLADAMNLDKNLLEQAKTQAKVNFSNWTSIDAILQWVNIARQLNISPQSVSDLVKLLTATLPQTYDKWENVAAILTAGLDTQKADALHIFLDESRSAALSKYYIGQVASQNPAIKNRDDLYQYLLIDNQVSAAIKTTPIAEAIASIQLYVNRALKNMEGNTVTSVISHPFFTHWDKYNKRYSTWAGVSQLVYYPENYIDPTIRIGRTKMMDTLLQSISQSQLNTDTVEDAFMSYLTSFEQVANLEVVSAYHDNASSDQGLTYFIGHSKTEVNQYYWRNVDHNKFSDGKFPANAWSEWHKIDCPINPYKSTIRPVIFQSRLHLIWLEQKKIAKQTENNHQTVEDYHYELKLAHIRYDGTWNTPITFDVSDKVSAVLNTPNLLRILKELTKSREYHKQLEESLKQYNDRNNPQYQIDLNIKQAKEERIQRLQEQLELELMKQQLGFYCTNHQDNKLLVMFYRKRDELDEYKRKVEELVEAERKVKEIAEKSSREDGISLPEYQEKQKAQKELEELIQELMQELMQELYISANMLLENIEPKQRKTIYELTYSQFDTNNAIRVNNPHEIKNNNILTLHNDTNGAQYMQWGAYRIRLNTLFARKLISRATAGIDTILSMETQKLPEPQLGKGFFANFTLPKYDQNVHGNERWFKIHIRNDNGLMNLYYKGILTDTETSITLFIPWSNTQSRVEIAVEYKGKFYQDQQKWETALFNFDETNNKFVLVNDVDNKKFVINDIEATVNKYKGFLDVSILIDQNTEPMDFNGANSLYFWELFYYAPMLIAQRLLHEQNFDEANRWLKYIWNPSGYIKHGQIQHYHWNVRPLLEDTSWNDDPLNSVDPDAIAQYDPMHYKVVTFMRTLDLLLDRGDYAYRQLERDTLNEAKMWYMQALHLLGDKPHLSFSSEWSKPSLGDAAGTERQKQHAQAMAALRQGDVSRHNNPTDLFLPQVNEVMQNYWQKLEQRLYNLRHNLTIDGQPLHLPIYATPADPKALLSAAVASSEGGVALSQPFMSLWRFPHMLENARGMVSQLTQFGSTLQNIIERQDAEALNTLLQNQAAELILTHLSIQDKTIAELDAEKIVLEKSKAGAQSRFDSYKKLYDENINAGENRAIALHASVAGLSTALQASRLAGAALDLAPNIFGLADGGSRWGAIAEATGNVMEFSASVMNTEADKISQSEAYRRRRQEWEIQRNHAEAEIKQIDAQLQSLAVRREAAVLQKASLKTQQEQTHAQLTFLQRKFSNQALYYWLRGRLAAIYFQFYDLAVARCLMAEMAYRWETNETAASFIKPGAWQGTHAGLLAGETLMLNLAQMEDAHLRWDQRALEVERTISLTQHYGALPEKSFNLATRISTLLAGGTTDSIDDHPVTLENDQLSAKISLSGLSLDNDYPDGNGVGNIRRIKQISVTLPALLGPYQDVQAILSYGGSEIGLAESCKSLAISHGINDSGQFQLDFNNGKFLPFEGIAINDTGTLTLSFPNATVKQENMLQTLSDIILHIRYTIRQ
ncbi:MULTISPECIES: Tc toxin subunit A-related protein [Photorhabdus]|uniref:Virulence plasmid A protein n=1 Tax=Photorhabdus luminescens TaxID=29488 RepID=A0A1G5R4X8_PHOLU|nr:neuraminidase-like domain-containing protein [Photorhabdus luminescens]SCZ69016.1 virulence plasmid A protein [Photorhabdus luminescens]